MVLPLPAGINCTAKGTTGAPTTGTWTTGDEITDSAATKWICTAGGSPGTWAQVGGGSALAAFWAKITNATEVAITAAGSATLNRMHVVSGTSTIYDITISGLSPSAGDVVGFRVKDWAAANKQFRLDAGGTVKIAGRTRYLALLHTNVVLLQWDGTDWQALDLCLDTPWVDSGATIGITAVTTNPTKNASPVRDAERWRRQGRDIHCLTTYSQTSAGTAGSGHVLVAIVGGFSVDTTWLNLVTGGTTSPNGQTFAMGTQDVGSNTAVAHLQMYDATHYRAFLSGSAVTSFWSDASNGFGNSTCRFSWQYSVPIADW